MECKKKPEIVYPCQWAYKLIGMDKERVRDAAEDILQGRQYLLSYSKSSKTGKYHSWSVELIVESEEDRNALFVQLKSHHQVKMVF